MFREDKSNAMVTDSVVLSVNKSPATIVMIVKDEKV